jgi:glycosyltransferase involved in cell wall biosynthesis
MTTSTGAAPVSLILAALNGEETIDAALASVAAQTTMPAELVFVDDGSTDGTVKRVEAWSQYLPLTIVKLPKNVGLSQARHAGVTRSTNRFIAFLDADDMLLPDHVAVLSSVAEERGGIVSPILVQWVPGAASALRMPRTSPLLALSRAHFYRPRVPPAHAQRLDILRHNFVASQSLFDRDDYFRVGGLRADAKIEDWDLAIRLIHSGVTVHPAPCPTYLYRRSPRGIMRSRRAPAGAVEVMQQALSLDLSSAERHVAKRTIDRLQAGERLAEAYEFARDGETAQARKSALNALGGTWPVRIRASMVCALPQRATALRDRT